AQRMGAQLLETRERPVEVFDLEQLEVGRATARVDEDLEILALERTCVGERADAADHRDPAMPRARRPPATALDVGRGRELPERVETDDEGFDAVEPSDAGPTVIVVSEVFGAQGANSRTVARVPGVA